MTFEKLSIGILSWRAHELGLAPFLASNLQAYHEKGLFGYSGENKIFFNEISEKDKKLAVENNVDCCGSPQNLGIFGGFKSLAENLNGEVLLLLENDLPLIADTKEIATEIETAYQAVLNNDVQVFRLRSRQNPGEKFDTLQKYYRYHDGSFSAFLRKMIRWEKAVRLTGTAIYAEENPHLKFPKRIQQVDKPPAPYFRIQAACLPWTNQSIIVRKDFFLNEIISHAEKNPMRNAQGLSDIEKEWNCSKWRNSNWHIGAMNGLFSHGLQAE